MKNKRSLFIFFHLAEFQGVRIRFTTRHLMVFVLFCFVLLVGWLVVVVFFWGGGLLLAAIEVRALNSIKALPIQKSAPCRHK